MSIEQGHQSMFSSTARKLVRSKTCARPVCRIECSCTIYQEKVFVFLTIGRVTKSQHALFSLQVAQKAATRPAKDRTNRHGRTTIMLRQLLDATKHDYELVFSLS